MDSPSAIELVLDNQRARTAADRADRSAGETAIPGAGELRERTITGGEISPWAVVNYLRHAAGMVKKVDRG